jgi:hypothetical protein
MWLARPRSDVMLSHRHKRRVEESGRVLFPEPFGRTRRHLPAYSRPCLGESM